MSGLGKSLAPITVVTTFSPSGYEAYARRMLDSFVQRWPASVRLVVYPEGTQGLSKAPNIEYREFPDWFPPWKKSLENVRGAHGNDPKHNRRKTKHDFRRDCVRFSHKIAAITDIGLELDTGWLIWLDADIYTHSLVTEEWLRSLHTDDKYMAWLNRRNTHPECGFMIFDCGSSIHQKFMLELRNRYESKKVLQMPETHDSYVTQQIVLQFVKAGWMGMPHNLSGEHDRFHHPFVRSELGSKMDHLKGPRKKQGASPHTEASKFRREEYWAKPTKKVRS